MPRLREFALRTTGDRTLVRAFELQTRCVAALYERLFPRFSTDKCWKVLVKCVSDNVLTQYRNLLGVYELDVHAETTSFFTLTDTQKKAWAFEHLQRGVYQLLDQTKWDKEPFVATFEQLQALDLHNAWVWKRKRSPSRRWLAEVCIEHNVHSCIISLIVRDRAEQEIMRQQLISELPSEWYYSSHLGFLAWDSDRHVSLVSKDRERKWEVELPEII